MIYPQIKTPFDVGIIFLILLLCLFYSYLALRAYSITASLPVTPDS